MQAYQAWGTVRGGNPPSFEDLAPKPGPTAKILTFPRAITGLVAAAAVAVSVAFLSNRPDSPPATAEIELAMPWPTETGFLLTWIQTTESDFEFPIDQILSTQPNQ